MNKNVVKNGLCGYLSPDGEYIACKSYEHMPTATQIVKRTAPQKISGSDFQNEKYLLEEVGYVEFTARGCIFKMRGVNKERRYLTSAQTQFLEDHIAHSNNSDQLRDIDFILNVNKEAKEGNILSEIEHNVLL